MRILLLTQYFPPETGAAQQRLSDLAAQLTSFGHEVTVLTAMPNYPQGKVFEQYKGHIFLEEKEGSIRILRGWSYVSHSRSFISRLLNYCSFAFVALWIGIIYAGSQDVIVTESPPLFLGVSGIILSWWRNASLTLNVSDLWPESAVSMGVLKNPFLIRMSSALELFIYGKSSVITGQTEGIVQAILARTSNTRVDLIPNGVDPERFENCSRQRTTTRTRFGFNDYFVVGFTGLHGLAYDFDSILHVAESMQNENSRISVLFVFFGDGPVKMRCRQLAESKKLRNVRFFAPQPGNAMPSIFSCLDAAIIPLRDSTFYAGTLPSRLFESMAAGIPTVLAIVEGEASRLLEQANGGIRVPPEDANALADAIRTLSQNPSLCRTLGENARRYVMAHYDRRELARRFAELLPSREAKIGLADKPDRKTSLNEVEIQTEIATQKGD